ncbi:MAG TPA: sulfotransferase [Rhizomicrobium sp.]|nr:sulfotransferase [Rhizomicrobium sp.]
MADCPLAWTLSVPWIVETRVEKIAFAHAGKPSRYVTEEETKDLLAGDSKQAEGRAREALAADPEDWQARALLGGALRQQKRYEEARAVLEPVVASAPHMNDAMREYGLALLWLGEREKGIAALRRAIDFRYHDTSAWYWLGEFLDFGESAAAVPDDERVNDARTAYLEERLEDAERLLRQLVAASPDNAAILKFLGDVLVRMGRWAEAKPLLEQSVELAPDSHAARFRCATMLFAHAHFTEALPHIDELRKRDPASKLYRAMRFVCLSRSHNSDCAAAEFQAVGDGHVDQPGLWLEYARLLRSEQSGDILAAIRKATELVPSYVDAYVAAAFSKSVKLDETFVAEVLALVSRAGLSYEDRARLHFALGKALEDMKCYRESFEHYRVSNDILCTSRNFGAEISTRFKQRVKRFFRPRFFQERQGWGHPALDPIFIVGLPRAGSTLVEQILASHSCIEGLGELPDLGEITRRLEKEGQEQEMPPYPVLLRDIDAERFRSLGEEYLETTRCRRQTGKPFFTDKMPGNYTHVEFIHLALPNAKIIDVRRHPLDCCFSCFKHYFPGGQPLSTNLRDIGRSYVDYVELMAFFDQLLPGRAHRIIYEHLVDDPEREVRRLLDHIGLPFEEQCLRFHENRRFVATLSQEQVRTPLYRTGREQWRHYEPWLDPLKEELGYVLACYPDVPEYFAGIHARWKRPLSLGQGANPFATVKGVRQMPFEIASDISGFAA